jgi:hypothetical protein
MKCPLAFVLLSIALFLSCKKDCDELGGHTIKLKAIYFPIDTFITTGDPEIIIVQKVETFHYDVLQRLTTRYIYGLYHTDSISNDTTEVYTYSYVNNSSTISAYTHQNFEGTFHHVLIYDAQGRISKDSVTNPQSGNNKVSAFTYKQDTIIYVGRQNYVIGTEMIIDTMIFTDGKILKEKITKTINNESPFVWEISYTLTPNLNPLGYLNNFILLASDRKNGTNSIIFTILTPENISQLLPSAVVMKYWGTTIPLTQYQTDFNYSADASGRVHSIIDSEEGETIYEYY